MLSEAIIGIAGTAKNTGKTTTTASIMEELRSRGTPFFLTSIGYDGESLDNITGLPKPKLSVKPGDIIATAEKCVTVSTAGMERVQDTGISTPLGQVMIMQVISPGLAVTAGPNKSAEVRQLVKIFHNLGPGVTIIDGALNRIAPMAETDGFILATGASKTPNIPLLSKETEVIWRIANLPTLPRAKELAEKQLGNVTLLDTGFVNIKALDRPSLMRESDVAEVWTEEVGDDWTLYIPGILSEKALSVMAARLAQKPVRLNLVFANPIKLMVASDPIAYFRLVEKLTDYGIFTGVVRSIPLLGVTVNPFYPEYRFDTKTYKPAYVDFRHLQLSIQRHIRAPVFNVVRQGAKGLADIITSVAYPWSKTPTVYFD